MSTTTTPHPLRVVWPVNVDHEVLKLLESERQDRKEPYNRILRRLLGLKDVRVPRGRPPRKKKGGK